jgi:2-oxoglutarate dehydrogenase E1 component
VANGAGAGTAVADSPARDGVTAAPAQQQPPAAEEQARQGRHAQPPAAQSPAAQPTQASAPQQPSTAPAQPAEQAQPPAQQPSAKPAAKAPAAGPAPAGGADTVPLKGPAARVVTNMETSLQVPTATERPRPVPAKLLIDNRVVINNHLKRGRAARSPSPTSSATPWCRLCKAMPEMNYGYARSTASRRSVKPSTSTSARDRPAEARRHPPAARAGHQAGRGDGLRAVLVGLRGRRAPRAHNKLTADDFAGTTITPDQPGHDRHRPLGAAADGGAGLHHRRRRDGVPAEYQARRPRRSPGLAVSKTLTLTSTYDHRIIQGAQSGDFLRRIHALLLGEDDFYDESSARCASRTSRCAGSATSPPTHEDDVVKQARVRSSSTPTACAGTSWPTPTRWSSASARTPTSTSSTTA